MHASSHSQIRHAQRDMVVPPGEAAVAMGPSTDSPGWGRTPSPGNGMPWDGLEHKVGAEWTLIRDGGSPVFSKLGLSWREWPRAVCT